MRIFFLHVRSRLSSLSLPPPPPLPPAFVIRLTFSTSSPPSIPYMPYHARVSSPTIHNNKFVRSIRVFVPFASCPSSRGILYKASPGDEHRDTVIEPNGGHWSPGTATGRPPSFPPSHPSLPLSICLPASTLTYRLGTAAVNAPLKADRWISLGSAHTTRFGSFL